MPSRSLDTFQSDAGSPSLRLLAKISHYELLSRMWSDKADTSPVKTRDFAYVESLPVRVQEGQTPGEISTVSSKDFSRLLSGPTVDICVGKQKRRWSLHRNLLLQHSPLFEQTLMSASSQKGKQADRTVDLLEHDPSGFELFVKWLYQGRLDDTSAFSDEQKYEHAVACHKLYLLCDRFEMTELKNLSMDRYRDCLNEARLVPDAEEINDMYRSSPAGSPFRRLVTRIAARQIMDPDADRDARGYRSCFRDNPDFAVDLVNAIRIGTAGVLFDDPTEGDDCSYHEHSDGAGCRHRPRVVTGSESRDLTYLRLLKGSPTTSADSRSSSSDLSVLMTPATSKKETSPDGTRPPPTPTPATGDQIKATQVESAIASSAMGSSMDEDVLKLDGDRGSRKGQGNEVSRVEGSPLSYVSALRMLQEKRGPRIGRDLFDDMA